MNKILNNYSEFLKKQMYRYGSDDYMKGFYGFIVVLVLSLARDIYFHNGNFGFMTGFSSAMIPSCALSYALTRKQ